MATTVTVETDKFPPPKGSPRLNRLQAAIQAVVQQELGDSSTRVNIIRRK